ncbi:hypothetical protein CSV78_04020 [Sporosarcina sp. P16a]|uniref:VCBS domain-containing protein n=1 Tax=unclassified Sporosarcina TaxID=2647733 RepID=UPI000C16D767|nr:MULTISPECIES: VCBS domain-containing protein [unclassified Sporosarcina]PIC67967.1 hypothetical protein CSV78_04020 [Sporosarcina sp. P16a]PIC94276.1 hypothetical protein CSV70_00660 [Sporosarcina sp. P25]
MKKKALITTASIFALSALTPAVSAAVEDSVKYEDAQAGFYNVKTGKVLSSDSFVYLSTSEKVQILTDQFFYFADGQGGAIQAVHLLEAETDEILISKIVEQMKVENEFNVRLTADGRVIFLSKEDVSNSLQDAIDKAKEQLEQLTDEQKKAVEAAIKEAEALLKDVNASIDDLNKALKKLEDAINGANTVDPSVKAAQDAVKLAQQTLKKEDIEKAKQLVSNLEAGAIKDELQNILNGLSSPTIDLSGLDDLIKEAQNIVSNDAHLYTAESLKSLELAIQKAKIVRQQYDGKDLTTEAQQVITRETNDLRIVIDQLVKAKELTFTPTEETKKNAPLFLDPVVTKLADQQKNSGGVLGLDIGVLELGLLSASQISQISENNRFHIDVKKGTTLDATSSVAIHTILGGHAFQVFVMKQNEEGDYINIDTYKGSSGGALGITVPTKIDMKTLEEGSYEIILSVKEGLSVVQVIPFKLINLVEKDFNQVATEDSRVSGNVLLGQNLGQDDNLIVTDIREKSAGTSQSIGINGTVIQGKYGQLQINKNGTYNYMPKSDRAIVGKVELFEFTMKDTVDNRTAKGTLEIQLGKVAEE